ncbi:hypothetical protein PLEOSDRAFT_163557 [Pleurotus ostreatus PC15]|uniref:Peptidase C14 caspase domain-containing protein n=2 Tax=Pleurotus TaxID=5320 RepID=A0A067NEX4_PLEO1|nr:hypothetical protein CCMSSC00406_0003089 [Pleurotus cornucopiae]KDQ22667.1 hypothetical protein PLEOSDRAFT_163557 [Pleurotus ostreatus PC15]
MCEPRVKRKALLIGISDDGSGQPLPDGPKNDVFQMKHLLLDKYQYEDADIVLMCDSQEETRPYLAPTRENILHEIKNLVKDCQPGDRFVFHYSGHAGQQENLDGSELDGWDERLETATGPILDDELRTELVDKLCPGSQLIAVFDACHSATLLDLPHVGCHGFNANEILEEDVRVPTPTTILGQRTNLPPGRVRGATLSLKKPHLTLDTSFSRPTAISTSMTSIPPDKTEIFPTLAGLKYLSIDEKAKEEDIVNGPSSVAFYGHRCYNCPFPRQDNVSGSDLPRVLAISACKDSQVSYEDERGNGMTVALCDYLNANPDHSLNRLFNGVSFKLFKPAFDRVKSDEWNKYVHQNGGGFPNAYQQLSISSLQRLNPDYKITL